MPNFRFFSLLLAYFGLLFLSGCNTANGARNDQSRLEQPTTVFLVRHAEKDFGDDPDLTPEGQERAERLCEMLKNTNLAAIYSTDLRRTVQTAEPTAAAKDLQIRIYSPYDLRFFAPQLLRRHRGETILVVGHSNTTPALASLLDPNADYPRFSELDYTNLYIMSIPRQGDPKLLKLRF
jgi:2,3-bisphosphoglycerate-dependent phosphoglycerate mutase